MPYGLLNPYAVDPGRRGARRGARTALAGTLAAGAARAGRYRLR